MFFKQVRRNAAKNRKGNSLLFGSLVIAIIAFYTLLSLGRQDVMLFLAEMESDAVQRLLALLPEIYLVSLFFMFFLVYFACKYQTDSRRREFGMYLMLGMKRSRLFFTLFCETLWNSLVSLIIGLPAALFLTEGISIATAKIVGMGIISHRFSFSPEAVLWTVCGFAAVQMLSMLIICIPLGYTEPAQLLGRDMAKKQALMSRDKSSVCLLAGIILLIAAYYLGIFHLEGLSGRIFMMIFISGSLGTFLFYRGLGGFLGKRIRRRGRKAGGLAVFTGRQVQETVISQYKSLAIASLLLLMALSCVSYGISIGLNRTDGNHSAEFSIFGEEEEIDAFLQKGEIRSAVKTSYPMYLSVTEKEVEAKNLESPITTIDDSGNIVDNMHIDYVISEGSYNRMLKTMGKEPVKLGEKEAALYTSMHRDEEAFYEIMAKALKKGASVDIEEEEYALLPELFSDNIVADRAITLYMALILPDRLYRQLAAESGPYCRNVHLAHAFVEKKGLMQATWEVDKKLAASGLQYDSYLSGIGRTLFYAVAASYLTVYLGSVFLIIANTVIGMKYLIGQRQTMHRYRTLLMLGADVKAMYGSVKRQINTFFYLALGLAGVNSAAAIASMMTSLTRLPAGISLKSIILIAGIALPVFILAELLYMGIVKRTACREIHMLEQAERSDEV